jgi:hypothetical protein
MYLALVDKYGQIVSDDDNSQISVMIDARSSNSSDSSFPPFIEGTTQFSVSSGVVKVNDIAFAATPGFNYSLKFDSAAINPEKVAAAKAGGAYNHASLADSETAMLNETTYDSGYAA